MHKSSSQQQLLTKKIRKSELEKEIEIRQNCQEILEILSPGKTKNERTSEKYIVGCQGDDEHGAFKGVRRVINMF